MFKELEEINKKPKPFEFYTASELWTNEHTSQQMLNYHLNPDVDLSSRKHAFIGRSVAWMAETFKVNANTKIVDFGCGPGLYTTKLAQHQARVIGVDFSPRSIAYAKEVADKEGLRVNYVNQNYLDFETKDRFDIIIMIMCDFCVLSPDQKKTMLQKYNDLLASNGVLIFDAYSLKAFENRIESASYEKNQLHGFWSADDYYTFLNTFKYEKEKVVLDKYTIFEQKQKKTVYNWLQYYDPETLKKELSESGFTKTDLYANVAGDAFDPNADEFAIVARK
jgi:SAM-dependent methyltransferase